MITAELRGSVPELTHLWSKRLKQLSCGIIFWPFTVNYLVTVLSTLGSSAIVLIRSVQVDCFGLWKQHDEDTERRAHTPAGRVG